MNNLNSNLDRSQACVLVVDDDESARRSLAEILKLEGYQVEQSANATDAIDILSQRRFDVILLDLRMPLENSTQIPGITEKQAGLIVLQYAAKNTPNTPVIFLTAHGSLETAIEALRLKAVDYLLKPASPEQILAALDTAVERYQQELHLRTQAAALKQAQSIASDMVESLAKLEGSLKALKDTDELVAQTTPYNVELSLTERLAGTKQEAKATDLTHYMLDNKKTIAIDLSRREIRQEILNEDGQSNITLRLTLTPMEGKLMQVFWEKPGAVFTQQELVAQVHGFDASQQEAPALLRPLISRLKHKLASFPNGEKWIRSIRGIGYVFEIPPERSPIQ